MKINAKKLKAGRYVLSDACSLKKKIFAANSPFGDGFYTVVAENDGQMEEAGEIAIDSGVFGIAKVDKDFKAADGQYVFTIDDMAAVTADEEHFGCCYMNSDELVFFVDLESSIGGQLAAVVSCLQNEGGHTNANK